MAISIQQAACDCLAEYLGPKLTGVVVEPRWPDADKEKPRASLTIIPAGPRRDIPISITPISHVINQPLGVTTKWQIAACTQPIQLDVWALSDVGRDDIMARLDEFLNAGESALPDVYNADPVGHGVLLQMTGVWDTTVADFNFESPDQDDISSTVGQNIFRATYRGEAHFMLTVTSTTARQQVINFQANLTEA